MSDDGQTTESLRAWLQVMAATSGGRPSIRLFKSALRTTPWPSCYLCVLRAPDKGMRPQAGAAIYRRGSMPAADGARSARLAGPHCSRPDGSPHDTPFGTLDQWMDC